MKSISEDIAEKMNKIFFERHFMGGFGGTPHRPTFS